MKRLVFITVIILFSSVLLPAQECEKQKQKEKQLSHTIGISINEYTPNNRFDSRNYGGSIFYRRNIKPKNNCNNNNTNSYFSVNAGYGHFKKDGRKRDDYSATVGIGIITRSNSFPFTFLLGVELGGVHKEEKSYYDSNENLIAGAAKMMFTQGFRSGYIWHFSKHFNLDASISLMHIKDDMITPGVNIGLSYSF